MSVHRIVSPAEAARTFERAVEMFLDPRASAIVAWLRNSSVRNHLELVSRFDERMGALGAFEIRLDLISYEPAIEEGARGPMIRTGVEITTLITLEQGEDETFRKGWISDPSLADRLLAAIRTAWPMLDVPSFDPPAANDTAAPPPEAA